MESRYDLPPKALVVKGVYKKIPEYWPFNVIYEDEDMFITTAYDIGASAWQGQYIVRIDIYDKS